MSMPNTPETTPQRTDAHCDAATESANARTQDAPQRRTRYKAVLVGCIITAAIIACIAGIVLTDRALQAKSDIASMTAPVYFASDGQTGRFTVDIEYAVPASSDGQDQNPDGAQGEGDDGEGAAQNGGQDEGADAQGMGESGSENAAETVSIQMTWDDAWFFGNSSMSNDQLAFACKVISAAAEAQFAADTDAEQTSAFMEHVFATLGFGNAETVLGDNGAGYTVATKTIMSDDGEEKFVVAVCVHGLKPTENNSTGLFPTAKSASEDKIHAQLADSIVETLKQRIGVRSSSSVALLFCGQGANGDAAQDAADAARGTASGSLSIAPAESIFVYASEAPSGEDPANSDSSRKANAPDGASGNAGEPSGASKANDSAETETQTD